MLLLLEPEVAQTKIRKKEVNKKKEVKKKKKIKKE